MCYSQWTLNDEDFIHDLSDTFEQKEELEGRITFAFIIFLIFFFFFDFILRLTSYSKLRNSKVMVQQQSFSTIEQFITPI